MREEIGDTLRAARELRGWSLSELSRQTRIAEQYLEAIEEGRPDDLPHGPYQEAWIRTCCEVLDVEEPFETPDLPPSRVPLSVVRGIGLTMMFALIFVYSWARWGGGFEGEPEVPVVETRDQVVVVSARKRVPVKVWVDGVEVQNKTMAGGARASFEAFDEIELRVGSVEAVKLSFNGRSIVPQGRQDHPRRLVFIDDVGR